METNNKNKNKDIDWSRYGLGTETAQRVRANTSGFVDLSNNFEYSAGGHQAFGANELFAEEQGDVPWWKSNFFISQPVLFGTWDGVFTSCLINIFGVIVFLRSGWIVAEAGVLSAVLMVLSTVFIALITVLSSVGICERCRIESGGVYFVIAHVLGSKFGGSLGLLYCFGQAVGCALNVLGFGESMAELIGLGNSIWAVRFIAGAAVLLLGVINVAGVKWVIKLQFILLLILLLAGLDFMVGSFVHTDIEHGFEGWLSNNLKLNMFPNFSPSNNWFIVFGVFFPTITGILSGINMSGDLKAPSTNIPNGSLAAISTGTFLYLVFVIFLGATCKRSFLENDYLIAAKVSAFSVLLLAGLYVSSMSSCLGAMYGTPRVLQSIALENVIPSISILGTGRGPNKVPLYAMSVVAFVTVAFILIGEINVLAPIVTMPFLLTYASVDYAYFALAQTFDIQHQREQRFHKPRVQSSMLGSEENDLDILFPERTRHKTLRGESGSGSPSSPEENDDLALIMAKTHIHSKPKNWYSNLCNRWLSLFGAALKIVIMFLVNWVYAIICITVVFFVWLYIGTANPAVKPGLAAEFRFFKWLRIILLRCMGRRVYDYEQIVVTPVHPGLNVTSSQLNEDNEDFANRRRYHQSATVHGHMVNIDD
ncbi:solute carrier family 12 member 8 isoform X1 [Harmonia axyridis]|uniref:solute carrier family 12 member 8 isoform X1 n=1 Tax=Harmonia axyridis TaxID=115357 RepID=UPI001E275796|nr:solute carrier family 12 member 8 isoform X1 [Harmonia axyridis]XP_045482362.1 solute carrier family 12 member 8 isoform X1 [Harmonia axyridis]XP_045482363.1 solute carrier family 12 member 8 isoform X1 [Harmonia axyridis]XP_045482364.1 solute carrier family 12 member 8 isoform X1 [Harmonia axyridis]